MKLNRKGFTLMEMLIVIAIVAVLISVAVPVLSSQLERSREAVDLANVRAAYAQVSTEALLGKTDVTVTVNLKQKQAGWQSVDPVNIGGIVHSKNEGDTNNWKGNAAPGGSCEVSYNEAYGVVLTWNGTAAPVKPSYPFDTKHTNFFDDMLYATDFWKNDTLSNNALFEFDSLCPNSTYIPQINAELDKQTNSLLQRENCTWAFLGDGRDGYTADRYLFWTSLDTNKVGAGVKIPVLIQTGDGKYYVSETTTGERTKGNGTQKKTYIAVSEQITEKKDYKKFLKAEAQYSSLTEAYDAYVKALADPKYESVRASQTSAP
ncbi:prepilin-type N-terminal cleavage/methylation domain-containing protein [Oscillibacter sp. MCC667]|nr:prepilin-type N-terminal cleavage/methylation domain-containing protein [Oscillibacter sp. MCC667]